MNYNSGVKKEKVGVLSHQRIKGCLLFLISGALTWSSCTVGQFAEPVNGTSVKTDRLPSGVELPTSRGESSEASSSGGESNPQVDFPIIAPLPMAPVEAEAEADARDAEAPSEEEATEPAPPPAAQSKEPESPPTGDGASEAQSATTGVAESTTVAATAPVATSAPPPAAPPSPEPQACSDAEISVSESSSCERTCGEGRDELAQALSPTECACRPGFEWSSVVSACALSIKTVLLWGG